MRLNHLHLLLAVSSVALFHLLPLPAFPEDMEEEAGDAVIDLDDLTGKDREKAILNLCKSKDKGDAVALVSVLSEPKDGDSQEVIKAAFEALMRLKSQEIAEELLKAMNSPDPVLQGYGFRVYARACGAKAASELLPRLATAQATAKTDLLIALRDCPSPAVKSALQQLLKKGEVSVAVHLTLLRLGDATYSADILNYYGTASDTIRGLREGLKYPSDKRQAARDEAHIQRLIEEKADIRQELAQLPKESIPGFAQAAAKIRQQDVWSLLVRLFPKLVSEETVTLCGPLMESPSIELSTLVMQAIAGSKGPNKAEILRPAVERFSKSDSPELRKQAVSYGEVLDEPARVALAQSLMNDPDKWVRIECVEKLADWGAGNAKRAIQEMLKSTEDPDIRWSVEYAMTKLGE